MMAAAPEGGERVSTVSTHGEAGCPSPLSVCLTCAPHSTFWAKATLSEKHVCMGHHPSHAFTG